MCSSDLIKANQDSTSITQETSLDIESVRGVAQPSEAPAKPVETQEASIEPREIADISPARQVINKLNISGNVAGRRISVELTPPELGRVQIEFREVGSKLVGIIRPDNKNTMVELQKEAPALISRMTEAGINIKNLEFQMNNPQHGRDGSGQGGREFQSGAEGFSSGNGSEQSGYEKAGQDRNTYDEHSTDQTELDGESSDEREIAPANGGKVNVMI